MEPTAVNQAQHTENVQDQQAMNEQLHAAVEQKDERIQALEQQLNWFSRQLFGGYQPPGASIVGHSNGTQKLEFLLD
jgi:predicted RNase H-like nuclease (RuvC/YqgF family)